MPSEQNIPKIFISYSHDSPEHKRWVGEIATRLAHSGIHVIFDQWDLCPGSDVVKFMEHSLSNADRVLMVCTESYIRKADEGKGGVGYETMIVTGELVRDLGTSKFIPIVRQSSDEILLPKSMSTRFYINLNEGQQFEKQFEDLVRELHNTPALPRPPVGKNPFAKNPSGEEVPPESDYLVAASSYEIKNKNEDAIYQIALDIARRGDLVAWRRIIRQCKQPILEKLQNWRKINNANPPKKEDDLAPMVLSGISAYAPLFSIALAGIESGRDEFSNQLSVLDEILDPMGWECAGLVCLADFPLTAAFVYQVLYGAMCMLTNQFEIAVRFAHSRIKTRNDVKSSPLYQQHQIVGWPPSLNGNCKVAWSFIISLSEKWRWLDEPFGDSTEYKSCVCAYYMFLSLVEFADVVASGNEQRLFEASAIRFCVPHNFLYTPEEIERKAYRILLYHPEKIKSILKTAGITEEKAKTLWSKWIFHSDQWLSGVSEISLRRTDILFADLMNDLF